MREAVTDDLFPGKYKLGQIPKTRCRQIVAILCLLVTRERGDFPARARRFPAM
jgi:hypothetical protein